VNQSLEDWSLHVLLFSLLIETWQVTRKTAGGRT